MARYARQPSGYQTASGTRNRSCAHRRCVQKQNTACRNRVTVDTPSNWTRQVPVVLDASGVKEQRDLAYDRSISGVPKRRNRRAQPLAIVPVQPCVIGIPDSSKFLDGRSRVAPNRRQKHVPRSLSSGQERAGLPRLLQIRVRSQQTVDGHDRPTGRLRHALRRPAQA